MSSPYMRYEHTRRLTRVVITVIVSVVTAIAARWIPRPFGPGLHLVASIASGLGLIRMIWLFVNASHFV